MASFVIMPLHILQSTFAAYNLYLATISINNLLGYEELSKKAASYSSTAEHQLHKTRTTQASGTLALISSLITSTGLIFYTPQSTVLRVGLALANGTALVLARQHVSNFWAGKMRVPLPKTGDYNAAMRNTQEITNNMMYLILSWIGAGVVGLWL